MNLLLGLILFCISGIANAAPLERVERLVMPGNLSTAHAKYEKDCGQCHKRFEKGAQNDMCVKCHKEINKDLETKKGLHGNLKNIDSRKCSDCHPEHNGRDANIVPFDRDTFNHERTNFPLQGTHSFQNCIDCHKQEEKYRKASSNCVECHKEDDAHHEKLGKKCNECHLETIWGEAYYDHSKTKFDLKAMHRNVRCIDCHPNERYKNTPKNCLTCHKLDDVHEGNNGKKCEDCHSEYLWSEIKFDHNKDTKYELKDRHVTVDCQACHKGDVYKKIKHDCEVCHKDEDAHNTLFGSKCKDCHQTNSWKKTTFDHNKDTKFELLGKHRKVDCIACHPGDVYEDLKKECINCHKKDDPHEGQEGEKCQQCHKESGWDGQVFFDHDLTAFPLLDSHVLTPCEECHLTPAYQDAEVECKACHMKDDEKIHKERLGRNCALCHNANSWKKWFFDHNKQTDYKLDGAHKELDCHACHTVKIDKEFDLKTNCYSCHREDDRHDGAFGDRCERCHVTESFKKLILQK